MPQPPTSKGFQRDGFRRQSTGSMKYGPNWRLCAARGETSTVTMYRWHVNSGQNLLLLNSGSKLGLRRAGN